MKLQRLKTLQANLLRQFICAEWVCGFLMAVFFAIAAGSASYQSPEQSYYVMRAIACLAVGIVGMVAHGYLIDKAAHEMEKHDPHD